MAAERVAELLYAARVLAGINCLPATDGNFSARLADGRALVTRRGIEKRLLAESDLIEVSLDEFQPTEASSEWKLHRALYHARPDVYAILHVHAPNLGVFVAAGKVPDVKLLMEAEMTLGGIAMIPYAEPGSPDVGRLAVDMGNNAGVLLLERHGVVALGGSVQEALHRIERAEFLARVQLDMASLR
ncbi:MAG: class II aldolase/adducin family protein [bacterium]|nr:class II aldolase/adducin family protein [bacterium]